MKKFIVFILMALVMCSCSKTDLFKQTDYFVEQLETTYTSYGLLGGMEYTKYANDGYYHITPIGRLINVKIEEVVEDKEYEKLCKSLKKHYAKDNRVNNVYICNGGTVIIDCRN